MKWIIVALVIWLAWRFVAKPKPKPKRKAASMSDETAARALLGLDAAAGPDAIRAAHRRLVADTHPDRGGSAELTRRINAARDLLLKARS